MGSFRFIRRAFSFFPGLDNFRVFFTLDIPARKGYTFPSTFVKKSDNSGGYSHEQVKG